MDDFSLPLPHKNSIPPLPQKKLNSYCMVGLCCRPYGDIIFSRVLDESGEPIDELFVLQVKLPKILLRINNETPQFFLNGNFWKRNPVGEVYRVHRTKSNIQLM